MLAELEIENLAVIAHARIPFSQIGRASCSERV